MFVMITYPLSILAWCYSNFDVILHIPINRIIIHEYTLQNHQEAKFAIVEYLCPLGYDKALKCSNKNFEKPEKVKNHLLWFHKVPPLKIEYGHYMGLNFTPIERITYKY